jgi:hypothetical protein
MQYTRIRGVMSTFVVRIEIVSPVAGEVVADGRIIGKFECAIESEFLSVRNRIIKGVMMFFGNTERELQAASSAVPDRDSF